MWTKTTRNPETSSVLWRISYEYRTVIQATEQLTGFVCVSLYYCMWLTLLLYVTHSTTVCDSLYYCMWLTLLMYVTHSTNVCDSLY